MNVFPTTNKVQLMNVDCNLLIWKHSSSDCLTTLTGFIFFLLGQRQNFNRSRSMVVHKSPNRKVSHWWFHFCFILTYQSIAYLITFAIIIENKCLSQPYEVNIKYKTDDFILRETNTKRMQLSDKFSMNKTCAYEFLW